MTANLEERKQLFLKAINLEKPERIPRDTRFDVYWALDYAGYPIKGNLMDAKKLGEGMEKIAKNFDLDSCPVIVPRNPLFYSSLGAINFVESSEGIMQHPEISGMTVEDYPQFLEDPINCMIEKILPRIYTQLNKKESYKMIALLRGMQIQNDALIPIFGEIGRVGKKYELPSLSAGVIKAPLDFLADQLRGFTQITFDMRRCPKYVEQAAEAILPLMIRLAEMTPPSEDKLLTIPLHMAPFLNIKQFERFYWPTFKKMIDTLAKKGYKFKIYFEGDNTRFVDYLQELPAKCIWGVFEYADYKLVKEKLGKTMCLSGGLEVSLFQYGTKEECIDRAKELIDIMAPGGGYIFGVSKGVTFPNDGKPENIKAVWDFVREYGKY